MHWIPGVIHVHEVWLSLSVLPSLELVDDESRFRQLLFPVILNSISFESVS